MHAVAPVVQVVLHLQSLHTEEFGLNPVNSCVLLCAGTTEWKSLVVTYVCAAVGMTY